MAISAPHYYCLRELIRRREISKGGSLLEIGQANWYGDIKPPWGDGPPQDPFEIVSFLYSHLLEVSEVVSIDLTGTAAALKYDLNEWNEPHGNPNSFSLVINHGTAEHIFNVANVFRQMHINCAVGGLMIHESPWTGWLDHGFWSIHPTTYYDLAAANGYDIRYIAVNHVGYGSSVEIHSREQLLKMAAAGGVPNNAMLYVAMRKMRDEPFKIPMQGHYAKTLSKEAEQAWGTLR